MSRTLRRSSFRYLLRHPWHLALSVLGVALGVGVVFSIDVVNDSARRAFRLSTQATTGRATHQILGGTAGIPDSLYTTLRVREGFRDCAPVVEGFVGVPGLPGRAFQVLGIDPLADRPFRGYLTESYLDGPPDLGRFMTRPPAVYAPRSLAGELGLVPGDTLTVSFEGAEHSLSVLGFFNLDAELGEGLGNVLIMDIASAQEVLEARGALSRIDLMLPADGEASRLAELEALMPPGTQIERSRTRSRKIEQMSGAFSQNLFALSLLALVVGMFLIYNTMTFSVVRRREFIGDLRSLGVTRREIFSMVLIEAVAMGAVGTAAGMVIGSALAQGLVSMVTQSINDLYYVVHVREASAGAGSIAKGVLLGVGATVLSAAVPAREATSVPPRFVQNRSTSESRLTDMLPYLAGGGAAAFTLGTILLLIPSRGLFAAYAGLMLIILGFALWTPGFLTLTLGRLPAAIQTRIGTINRMAVRGVNAQLSRSAVAIAALAIAVGATVGVTTMVTSFRNTVVSWLETTLDADIYISPPTLVSRRNEATLDPGLVQAVRRLEGVRATNTIRSFMTETQHGLAHLVALDMSEPSRERFRLVQGDDSVWSAFDEGRAVLVSEPYAERHRVGLGDAVVLATPSGTVELPIRAVYRDYASDVGAVTLNLSAYRRLWNDDALSGIALFLEDPGAVTSTIRRINALLDGDNQVLVRSNRDLRERSIEIFDRTFAITNVLRLLTVLVAFIGVLTALMAAQLEHSRELGVLRAIGLTPGQLWRLVTTQTGLMGLLSGIIALPFGFILAAILIFVINKRSFGWTLDMSFGPATLIQALAIAVGAALLAGVYPGAKMARTSPARALREE